MIKFLPQKWVEGPELPRAGWFTEHAAGLVRKEPNIERDVTEIARHVGVSWKLLVTRMELEQSAISYEWNGSTSDYGGGHDGETQKLKYLCGVDKTDSGPRPGGWFEPRLQLLALALRFKYWYRGINPTNYAWRNWLELKEDEQYLPGVAFTRDGRTVVPENQISADCLRYTTHIPASFRLREIAQLWFPEDFETEYEAEEEEPPTRPFGKAVVCTENGDSFVGVVKGIGHDGRIELDDGSDGGMWISGDQVIAILRLDEIKTDVNG